MSYQSLFQVNYLGHWEAEELGGKGTGLTFTFKYCRLSSITSIIMGHWT